MHVYACDRWCSLGSLDGLKSPGVVFHNADSRVSFSEIFIQGIWNLVGICIKKTQKLSMWDFPGESHGLPWTYLHVVVQWLTKTLLTIQGAQV